MWGRRMRQKIRQLQRPQEAHACPHHRQAVHVSGAGLWQDLHPPLQPEEAPQGARQGRGEAVWIRQWWQRGGRQPAPHLQLPLLVLVPVPLDVRKLIAGLQGQRLDQLQGNPRRLQELTRGGDQHRVQASGDWTWRLVLQPLCPRHELRPPVPRPLIPPAWSPSWPLLPAHPAL